MSDNETFINCTHIGGYPIRVKWENYRLGKCKDGIGRGINFYPNSVNGSMIVKHYNLVDGEYKETKVVFKPREVFKIREAKTREETKK